MGADEKERGPLGRRIDVVRARTATALRAIALGIVTVIAGSFVQWMISVRVAGALAHTGGLGPGTLSDLLAASLSQVGLVLLLPLFAWPLGWLFEASPTRLCLGAAAFAEAWTLTVTYLANGSEVLLGRPIYLSAHLLLALAAGLLAALAFAHAQRLAQERDRSHRRIAPPGDEPPSADPVSEAGTGADASGSGTSR